MARKRAFDTTSVLLHAQRVFAEHGYAGTSIDMLVQATGLQRGSLYQAFGSKAGIFRECFLRSYDEGSSADLLLIALWERASVDTIVREKCIDITSDFEQRYHLSIADILYERIALRAKLINERS